MVDVEFKKKWDRFLAEVTQVQLVFFSFLLSCHKFLSKTQTQNTLFEKLAQPGVCGSEPCRVSTCHITGTSNSSVSLQRTDGKEAGGVGSELSFPPSNQPPGGTAVQSTVNKSAPRGGRTKMKLLGGGDKNPLLPLNFFKRTKKPKAILTTDNRPKLSDDFQSVADRTDAAGAPALIFSAIWLDIDLLVT